MSDGGSLRQARTDACTGHRIELCLCAILLFCFLSLFFSFLQALSACNRLVELGTALTHGGDGQHAEVRALQVGNEMTAAFLHRSWLKSQRQAEQDLLPQPMEETKRALPARSLKKHSRRSSSKK